MAIDCLTERRLTAKKQCAKKLYAENTALIGLCLRRFPLLTGDDREDAYSAAMLALWRAAQSFDPQRGFTFSTYAADCIRHSVINHVKRQRDTQKAQGWLSCVSLDAPINSKGRGGETDLSDLIADPQAERPGQRLVEGAGFEALVQSLPPRQQDVLRGVYAEERLMEDIAEEMGISKQRVGQMHLQALGILRGQSSRQRGRPKTVQHHARA